MTTTIDPIEWAVERWNAEVKNRPLRNVHRSALDTCWRQVIRYFGGDPEALLGPDHQDLVIANPDQFPEKPDLTPAPEGVEFAMRVFLHCDAAGLSHVLNFPGNRYHPPVVEGGVDVAELIDSLHPDEGRFLKAAGTWRVMTRPEITRYKARMARAAETLAEEEHAGRQMHRRQ